MAGLVSSPSISCAHIYLRQVPNIIFHLWIFQYVLLEDKTQKHITIITRIKKLSTISVRYLVSGQVFNCLLNISLCIPICIYLCICLCIKVYMYLSLYPFISQLFLIRIKMKATLCEQLVCLLMNKLHFSFFSSLHSTYWRNQVACF